MKLMIIFLKKKNIVYGLVILFLMALFSLFFFKNSRPAFNLSEGSPIKTDLTGDGKEDIIYVKNDNNKYYIEIKANDKTYTLEPDMDIKTLGIYSKQWPLKLNLVDISRDNIPEIFIQSSYRDNPLQHIFYWNGERFENIFSSSNNILGFMDFNNNKTTKVLSGNLTSERITMKNYIFANFKFYSYSYSYNDNFAGKNSVLTFINYIHSLPLGESSRPNDIFDPRISGKSIAAIGTLSGDNNKYTFQDALFMDTKFDKGGEISEVKWVLNFKGTSNINQEVSKNYNITLLLKPSMESSGEKIYKITSITANKMGPQ